VTHHEAGHVPEYVDPRRRQQPYERSAGNFHPAPPPSERGPFASRPPTAHTGAQPAFAQCNGILRSNRQSSRSPWPLSPTLSPFSVYCDLAARTRCPVNVARTPPSPSIQASLRDPFTTQVSPMQLRSRLGLLLVLLHLPVSVMAQEAAPPEDAPKPVLVSDLRSAIQQTAAVVEGRVASVEYSHEESRGTWTHVFLQGLQVHAGSLPNAGDTLAFSIFGGADPNGNFTSSSDVPVLLEGRHYILFLRNTAWGFSPVISEYSVELRESAGSQRVLSMSGQAVAGITGRALHQLDTGRDPVTNFIERAMSGSEFLASLHEQLEALGVSPSGPFYTEPDGSFCRLSKGKPASGKPIKDPEVTSSQRRTTP